MRFRGIIATPFAVIVISFVAAASLRAYPKGAPAGKTGGFGEGTCVQCHEGYDLNAGEGQLVYKGSPRIEGKDSGTSMVAEVVRTGDFESVLTWVVGLGAKVDFRVRTLSAPARLVVDFRDH